MKQYEALAAANAIHARRPPGVHASVAYQYSRGVYAVIVYGAGETVVLVDAEAVRTYQANHPVPATGASDEAQT